MLSPKRTKFQKYQKNITHKQKSNIQSLAFGKFGIKACACWRLPAKTIEAVRRVITRKLKRQGKLWIRIFPDTPVTKKPAEVRMGKGKGPIHFWIANVAKGHILFELDGVSKQQAFEAFKLIQEKIPFAIQFIQYD